MSAIKNAQRLEKSEEKREAEAKHYLPGRRRTGVGPNVGCVCSPPENRAGVRLQRLKRLAEALAEAKTTLAHYGESGGGLKQIRTRRVEVWWCRTRPVQCGAGGVDRRVGDRRRARRS